MDIDYEVKMGMLIKMLDNAFGQYLNSQSNDIGLTASQCRILGFIHHHRNKGEVYPIDVEQECHIKRPTVTGILQRLEKNGFITLTQSEKDRRYKQIQLTDKAHAHHVMMQQRIDEAEAKLIQNISDEELQLLHHLLLRMIENMSE